MRNRNKEIGLCIKNLRERRGVSQADLGEAIGVSYQQIQKYEKGVTPVTVERLEQIGLALEIPPSEVLSNIDIWKVRDKPMLPYEITKKTADRFAGVLSPDETLLLKKFRSIKNEKLRKFVLSQIRAIVMADKELNKKE